MSTYDFDRQIDRSGTHSIKWDLYKDRDIIPMWVADMDFQSPPEVLETLHERINHGVFGYTKTPEALNLAVKDHLKAHYDWTIDTEWLVWLPGLVVGLNLACRSFTQDTEEVITFTPVYPPFLSAPRLSKRRLIRIPLSKQDARYTFDTDDFIQHLTPNTKLLLLCSPHNPVGRSFSAGELRSIAETCVEHNIVICSDEIHCDLVLDPKQHVCTGSLSKAIEQQTITLMSPSKTFNLPGLNCSFAVIPNETLRRRFQTTGQGIVPHCNALGYEAALAAYRHGESWRQALLNTLRANREVVEDTINALPQLSMDHVEATYLAWINAENLECTDPAHFFEQAGVGLSDGRQFDGPGHVRLNFGCTRPTLLRALERIKRAVT